VFHVSFGGLGALFWGLSPPKPPRCDGTELNSGRRFGGLELFVVWKNEGVQPLIGVKLVCCSQVWW